MRREGTAPNPSPKGLTPVFAARPAAAGRAGLFLHRVIPVSSDMGYTRKKGNSLHRGYNPAMKNKRSDIPKVCWMHRACGAEEKDAPFFCHPNSGTDFGLFEGFCHDI